MITETDRYDQCLQIIDASYTRRNDPDDRGARARRLWNLTHAMWRGYCERYPLSSEPFTIQNIELPFRVPVVSPYTGAIATSFDMAGKIDGIVSCAPGGKPSKYLLEHKTAANVDDHYLARLLHDFQTGSYVLNYEAATGEILDGVFYNILTKKNLRQGEGETEEEFQSRYAELCSKNKNGKSSAKRKIAETDDEFRERLHAEHYSKPEAFIRQQLFFPRHLLDEIRCEIWDVKDGLLAARRSGRYYRNPSMCESFLGRCMYADVCWSACPDDPGQDFEIAPAHDAHSELPGELTIVDGGRELLTYSSLSMFRDCRRKYEYRYLRRFAPIEPNENLYLGQIIHLLLETWYAPAGVALMGEGGVDYVVE